MFLLGVSAGLFVLISLIVLVPGRPRPRAEGGGMVWLGGPSRSEYGVSTQGLVLTGRRAHWLGTDEVDWVAAAETAEPGRRVGGASAGW